MSSDTGEVSPPVGDRFVNGCSQVTAPFFCLAPGNRRCFPPAIPELELTLPHGLS